MRNQVPYRTNENKKIKLTKQEKVFNVIQAEKRKAQALEEKKNKS
jgi:hypothetical protein